MKSIVTAAVFAAFMAVGSSSSHAFFGLFTDMAPAVHVKGSNNGANGNFHQWKKAFFSNHDSAGADSECEGESES